MAEHRQAGQGGHQHRHAEAFVALAKLVNCRSFIGIAHEVHVTLHDVGIEFEGVLDDGAVLGVFFVAHHVHECAVVDAMHAEGADKVALHEPEGFGQQQRAGHFRCDAVDHLAPEFMRHVLVEFAPASCCIRRAREWRRWSLGPETRGDGNGAWPASWRRRSE